MKNLIFIIFFLLFFSSLSFSFGLNSNSNDAKDGGREDLSFLNVQNSNLKKGKDAIKKALKYEKKDKIEKAKKFFEKSLRYLILAYQEYPDNIEILFNLGFSYNKVGDFIMSEIYYKEGLSVDPNNFLINKKLGELYFYTKRLKLANERLKVLSTCNCEEYADLKNIINKN